MIPVEMTGHDVVEGVVVEPRQAIGAVRIGPDPGLERGLDLGELLLGRLRLDRVENAPLAVAVLHGVEDLRDRRVQRVRQEIAGVATMRAPVGGARGLHDSCRAFTVQQASSGVWWMVMSASIVSLTKAMMSAAGIQGAPRRAVMSEGRRSAAGPAERRDVAREGRVEGLGGLRCGGELGADRTGEIGVRCQPRAVRGIAEDRVAEFTDHGVDIAVQELRDVRRDRRRRARSARRRARRRPR